MEKTIYFKHAGPALKLYMDVEKYFQSTSIDPIIKELIKLRASQINKCAYCLNMHVVDAIKYGETHQRIHLLNAWHETSLFSDKEKAVLNLVEKVTKIENGVTKEDLDLVLEHFSEKELADIIIMISQINTWNRLNITVCADINPNYK